MKILIAVDGSAHALRAIDAVAQWARAQAQVEVVLLNVRELPIVYSEMPAAAIGQLEQALVQRQDDVLAEAGAHARECGLKVVDVRRASGPPAAEIAAQARDTGAEQIAMGTRGMGAVGAFFVGSVAQRVVHEAAVPVLLAK